MRLALLEILMIANACCGAEIIVVRLIAFAGSGAEIILIGLE